MGWMVTVNSEEFIRRLRGLTEIDKPDEQGGGHDVDPGNLRPFVRSAEKANGQGILSEGINPCGPQVAQSAGIPRQSRAFDPDRRLTFPTLGRCTLRRARIETEECW